ncbi:MAG: helix-turn-helix domain-containing protein [Acidimicrobiales bacterium]|jgi:nitroimidazol reductase NimA-like FMN-containing flavoprotein (pyridoxamine 5'-phosphate oxidase superfamily)
MGAAASGSQASDLGRRVARRREELALSVDELARRTGMDPGFLEYLERSSPISLSSNDLARLALALETSSASLLGGDIGRPPGRAGAAPRPRLETMTRQQSEDHLGSGGVGRIVFDGDAGPVALPMNFAFTEGVVVFRTTERLALSLTAQRAVSFEVDRIDEAVSEGWSVLLTGQARLVTEPAELQSLASAEFEPWAGDEDRNAVVSIDPTEISGRAIRAMPVVEPPG